jgi:hypothetical protein
MAPRLMALCLVTIGCGVSTPDVASTDEQGLQGPSASAIPANADYDGDGITDIAVKDSNGVWYIDFGSNGYGGRWDAAYWGYGGASAVPVPADYDHDGSADLAVHDGATGTWYIDYSSNGFGAWDWSAAGYGDTTVVPVPGDYDGDGYADLSIKDSSGCWYIDYAKDGYNGWNWIGCGYGDSSVTPAPADYDGDGSTDIAIKDSSASGCWYIDYAAGGFGGWNWIGCAYGATASGFVPVLTPADYDGDGKDDIAQKDASGAWYIDYASNGFGGWGAILNNGYGGSSATAVPGRYHHDGVDLSSYNTTTATWSIDYASNGFASWDISVPVTGRPNADTSSPYIYATQIFGANDQVLGGYGSPNTIPTTPNLTIGVRYTAVVTLQPGTQSFAGQACGQNKCPANYRCDPTTNTCLNAEGVEVNPDLHVPAALNLENSTGSTGDMPEVSCLDRQGENGCRSFTGCPDDNKCAAAFVPPDCPGCTATAICNSATKVCNIHRRYGITCSAPGNMPLGFELTSRLNPDYGIRVFCTANGHTGVYGTVTSRSQNGAGVYVAGNPIGGARVTSGIWQVTSAADGTWSLPSLSGGPLTVTISAPGYSKAIAVNVTVPPGSGVDVDTPLEEDFSSESAWVARGMTYTTYIDYSHGRTIFHVVTMPTATATLSLESSGQLPWRSLVQIATGYGSASVAMINGGEFNSDGSSVAYYYSHDAFMPSTTLCDPKTYYAQPYPTIIQQPRTWPLLTVNGESTGQSISIVPSDTNFTNQASDSLGNSCDPTTEWTNVAGQITWNASHVDYALQSVPFLLNNGEVINSGILDDKGDPDAALSRTSIGVSANNVYIVVADGEGVMGGNGATASQAGNLFKNQLQATTAMNLDSGLSTEMVLNGVAGQRIINTITGEDSRINVNPYLATIQFPFVGAVANYIRAGQ